LIRYIQAVHHRTPARSRYFVELLARVTHCPQNLVCGFGAHTRHNASRLEATKGSCERYTLEFGFFTRPPAWGGKTTFHHCPLEQPQASGRYDVQADAVGAGGLTSNRDAACIAAECCDVISNPDHRRALVQKTVIAGGWISGHFVRESRMRKKPEGPQPVIRC